MNMRSLLPMLVLAAVATPGVQAASAPVANRSPLQLNAFSALPLGSVMPKGWLLEQLRLQAQGLSGHLDEFWGDLGPQSANAFNALPLGSVMPKGWLLEQLRL